MRYFYTVLIGVLISFQAYSQGRMLLVGGGSEGSWSDEPYSWGIENATNKKVAIISYNSETQDLPDYFLELGATEATNFQIDTKEYANSEELQEAISAYDFFFFKGGDQANYYETYKGTNFIDVITSKYNEGGVIGGTSAGMAILSKVLFTAQNGSVFPDDGLINIESSKFVLENDFLDLKPGFIFDTHFVERGRIFRLMAFMANWQLNQSENITGIGVDDQTALCINSDNLAEVHGTGAITVIKPSTFQFANNTFISDSMETISLVDGQSINLNTFEITEGPSSNISINQDKEDGNYIVFLSSGDEIGDNLGFMDAFVNENDPEDKIILVSGNTSMTNSIRSRLFAFGASSVDVLPITENYNHEDSLHIRNQIRRSEKVLFVANDHEDLFAFLEDGPTGELLKAHLFRNDIVTGFIGEDSRYAGPAFVTNHISEADASYRNRLDFEVGLGLLKTTAIMPNTIDGSTTDFYENTTSSIPYLMADNDLAFGIYINEGSFVRIGNNDGFNTISSTGDLSSFLVKNKSSVFDFSSERNVTAFDNYLYQVINAGHSAVLGTPVPTDDEAYELEVEPPVITNSKAFKDIQITTNYSNLIIQNPNKLDLELQLIDLRGRLVLEQQFKGNLAVQDQQILSGFKLLVIKSKDQRNMFVRKLYFR
ncbi:MAG: cyanophycinase [Bacteroidota bacterium]